MGLEELTAYWKELWIQDPLYTRQINLAVLSERMISVSKKGCRGQQKQKNFRLVSFKAYSVRSLGLRREQFSNFELLYLDFRAGRPAANARQCSIATPKRKLEQARIFVEHRDLRDTVRAA